MTAIIAARIDGKYHMVADRALSSGHMTYLCKNKIFDLGNGCVGAFAGDAPACQAMHNALIKDPDLPDGFTIPEDMEAWGLLYRDGKMFCIDSHGYEEEVCYEEGSYMVIGCASEVVRGFLGTKLFRFMESFHLKDAIRRAHEIMPGAVSAEYTEWKEGE